MNTDSIVQARIHPAIGIARVGDSPDDYFVGPETPTAGDPPQGGYRDANGRLKRQAALFRIYGLDEGGNVVAELTSADAEISWNVQVANKKAAWYEFSIALDLKPEASATQSPRRNPAICSGDRPKLAIDPGARTISGVNQTAPAFDTGTFLGESVYLGELRTDGAGRLLFLGGRGKSGSPLPGYTLNTFANNPVWYDDISDGPVEATVTIGGRTIPTDGAWVVTAPPNYAPDLIPLVSMYDVIYDALAGYVIDASAKTSFTNDILPIFDRLTRLQWVNKGFFAMFGFQGPFDFARAGFMERLAAPGDEYQEIRTQIFNLFRNPSGPSFESWQWPPIYGDGLNVPVESGESPRNALSVTPTMYSRLQDWMNGNFASDYPPSAPPPTTLDAVPLAQQPDTLDCAALTFCAGGPFHPGCEMTWPMRRTSLYRGKFRLRRRPENEPLQDYGDFLTQTTVLGSSGPLAASGPGDITRWMAVPWQADTASCLDGYPQFENPSLFSPDDYLPTFWPARAPNEVLAEADYQIAIDSKQPLDARLAAFNRRQPWLRSLGQSDPYVEQLTRMVTRFGSVGVIEKRPGIAGDPNFPAEMFVENVPQVLVAAPAALKPADVSALSRTILHARFGGRRRV